MATREELDFVENTKHNVKCLLNEATNLFLYRRVILNRGKYKGKRAQIISIIVDNNDGLKFLCRVFSTKDPHAFVDSPENLEAKAYRPITHFKILEEKGESDAIRI